MIFKVIFFLHCIPKETEDKTNANANCIASLILLLSLQKS